MAGSPTAALPVARGHINAHKVRDDYFFLDFTHFSIVNYEMHY